MMNDSVREELEVKKSPILKSNVMEKKEFFNIPKMTETPIIKAKINAPIASPMPKPPVEKTVTSEIAPKTTTPTLVEFQSKNTAIPEWRVQIQNAVRQRQDLGSVPNQSPVVMTSGANALKLQPKYEPQEESASAPETETVSHANPTLNAALKRIAKSRRQFLVTEEVALAPIVEAETPAPSKNYPFRIAAKEGAILPEPKPATVNHLVKPHSAAPKAEAKKFDTNKLPPIASEVSEAFDIHKTSADDIHKTSAEEELTKTELKLVEPQEEAEEIEDLAPFAMRFNAGLFDLIIGSFITLILLSPFMLKGGWFTLGGFLGFLAICAVVMFVYMTASVGFYGRTLGMRLFALEVVDIEGENYPTIHQAAVSSSIYLLSMAFGGAGFLTLPFNEEKRAVHDIASGTIVVKEI
jgi:uncharacterized RDD family membrane protein YckC